MKSSYDVALAASPDDVWHALTDLEAVVVALPGATLERDGDALTGSVKTKLGVVQVTYRVTARADIGVSGRHVAVVVVTGKEARGRGTLAASLTVTVRPGDSDDASAVAVNADIDVTGRGAEADPDAWTALLGSLLHAVLAFPRLESEPGLEPAVTVDETPVPPEVITPGRPVEPGRPLYAPPDRPADRGLDPRVIAAMVGIVLLMLGWRRRRRR